SSPSFPAVELDVRPPSPQQTGYTRGQARGRLKMRSGRTVRGQQLEMDRAVAFSLMDSGTTSSPMCRRGDAWSGGASSRAGTLRRFPRRGLPVPLLQELLSLLELASPRCRQALACAVDEELDHPYARAGSLRADRPARHGACDRGGVLGEEVLRGPR